MLTLPPAPHDGPLAIAFSGGLDSTVLLHWLAARADVREELDRLSAHISSARQMLTAGEAAGRKLDFLCQELNREANTLCSKSASLELTNAGLALKSLIDQFREQVQNVE